MTYRIKSDDHSNHNLPIGAEVTRLDTADAPDWSDDGVEWYTQGIEGDEVAIDARDLTDLPAGYRWATAEECENWANQPGALVVPRTADANGVPYTQGEADIAVPL